jgi:tripartite ATP-independent transporter DctM subunit
MLSFLGISFSFLLLLGVPVAITLAAITIFSFVKIGNPMLFLMIPQRMFSTVEEIVLLAIPFFILSGEIMNRAQITDKLIAFVTSLIGNIRGGLAHTVVVTEILFSGITGSAVADMVALGKVLIPGMEKEQYPREFSTAVTAASAVNGPIIPPSIPMLVYAAVMNISVAGLFLSGLLPGIVMAVFLMIFIGVIASRRQYGERRKFEGYKVLMVNFVRGIPALLMPVIIMGGILSGFFTPTQASVVACIYGLVLGVLFYRTIKVKDIGPILKSTVGPTAMILFILASAKAFSWVITYTRLVDYSTSFLISISANKYVFLLIVNIVMFFAGMFLDMGFSIIVMAPLMAPAAYALGVVPLHFGLIVIFNLSIGMLSPPFGLLLFAASGVSHVPVTRLSRAVGWFLLAEVLALLAITYVPFFSLSLPRLLGYIR